jgi:hypothetical protein
MPRLAKKGLSSSLVCHNFFRRFVYELFKQSGTLCRAFCSIPVLNELRSVFGLILKVLKHFTCSLKETRSSYPHTWLAAISGFSIFHSIGMHLLSSEGTFQEPLEMTESHSALYLRDPRHSIRNKSFPSRPRFQAKRI